MELGSLCKSVQVEQNCMKLQVNTTLHLKKEKKVLWIEVAAFYFFKRSSFAILGKKRAHVEG